MIVPLLPRALRLCVALPLLAALSVTARADSTTGLTGGGQPFDNMQPSLVLNEFMSLRGVFPTSDPDGLSYASGLGSVRMFAGTFAPYATPFAQGQLQSIAQNTALFSLLGNSYGGNGTTTFALPDLTGRTAVHAGTGPFLLGQQSGAQQLTLTQAQLPAHTHGLPGSLGPTGSTGGSQPFDNRQPSLGLNYVIATNPNLPAATGGNTLLGQVALFSGSFAPGGFQFAAGQVLPVAQNQDLFNVIGAAYGGDGITTFALPDLRGRTVIGAGQAPGLSDRALGAPGGDAGPTLTEAQMPTHSHTLPPSAEITGNAGGNQPFDNMQPYSALHYMIAVQGIFPSRDGAGSAPEDLLLGEILMFAGKTAPSGFVFAEGQLLSIAQNQALFSLFGTTYGGDGITTFALPDLRGRTVIGSGGQWDLGETFGAEQHVMTLGELPAHLHAVPEPSIVAYLSLGLAGCLYVVARQRRRQSEGNRST